MIDNVGEAFLEFIRVNVKRGVIPNRSKTHPQTPLDPRHIYDHIRRMYLDPELRRSIQPGNRDAPQLQDSGEGPDLYQELLVWYTFCDSRFLDITQPPPDLNAP